MGFYYYYYYDYSIGSYWCWIKKLVAFFFRLFVMKALVQHFSLIKLENTRESKAVWLMSVEALTFPFIMHREKHILSFWNSHWRMG